MFDVFGDDLDLAVDAGEGESGWEDGSAHYVDVVVLEVVEQLGVDGGWYYLALQEQFGRVLWEEIVYTRVGLGLLFILHSDVEKSTDGID